MRPVVLVILLLALAPRALAAPGDGVDVAAQPLWDVLELTNGSEYRGVIVEQTPGTSYTVKLASGQVVVVQASEVKAVRKEPNVAAQQPVTPVLPAEEAPARPSRPVFGVGVLFALPVGDFGDSSLVLGVGPSVHLSYLIPVGSLDLSFGLDARVAFWFWQDDGFNGDSGLTTAWTLDPHLHGRIQRARGGVRPYANLTIGPELNATTSDREGFHNRTGFALNVDLGAAIDLGRMSLDLALTIHPPTASFFAGDDAVKTTWMGLLVGASF